MSLLDLVHKPCKEGKHLWWPPWHTTKSCLLCGRLNKLQAGSNTLYLQNNLVQWTSDGTPTDPDSIGMNTTNGRPKVYVDSAVRELLHLQEGGLWTLKYSTDLTSASSAVSMTGLNGAADDLYVLIARIKGYSGAGVTYTIRPLGLTSNQVMVYMRSYGGTQGSGTQTTRLIVGTGYGDSGLYSATTIVVIFHPRYSVSSTTVFRSYASICGSGSTTTATTNAMVCGGCWYETTSNITNMSFNATWAMQAGSSFRLWKVNI